MIITFAKPVHAPEIAQLIAEVLPLLTTHTDARDAEKFLASVSAEAIATYIYSSNFLYRVGFIDNKLVGVIAIRNGTHLFHLFITPALQGRGLAKQLWLAAKEHAIHMAQKSASLNEITATTMTMTVSSSLVAVPVYRSFGFLLSGEKTYKNGVTYIPMTL